jgi:hypothetical protein
MVRLLTAMVSLVKGVGAADDTPKVWFWSAIKSYSARTDQLPANAYSTPTPPVPPQLVELVENANGALELLLLTQAKPPLP